MRHEGHREASHKPKGRIQCFRPGQNYAVPAAAQGAAESGVDARKGDCVGLVLDNQVGPERPVERCYRVNSGIGRNQWHSTPIPSTPQIEHPDPS
jgi:hypothetical protein